MAENDFDSIPIKNIQDLYLSLENYLVLNCIDLHLDELVQMVILIISSNTKQDYEMESELIDLLLPSCLDMIGEIVKNRASIVKSYNMIYSNNTITAKEFTPSTISKYTNHKSTARRPVITQKMVVHTESEKQMKKMLRKYERKLNKEKAKGIDSNFSETRTLKQETEVALLTSLAGPVFKEKPCVEEERYPFVFDSFTKAKSSAAFVSGHKIALPNGFQRNDLKQYEEIHIPAPVFDTFEEIISEDHFVDVEQDFDPIGKKAFLGIKKLNRVQSIVFNTACNTNNNMLVCAPTGAGKTNVAMLSIVNELKKVVDAETMQLINQDFKIVYIAPIKALASEMTAHFSERLNRFKIKVRELTGDIQLSKAEISETQMIITTPEKWDVVTRKPKGGEDLMQNLQLLIIDEVHLLQSDRGPVLEALVARTLRYVESTQKTIRIVGLSATLPNYVDVARFLRVNCREGLFFFDSRFRPVPLNQTFIGVKSNQVSRQNDEMDEVCYDKLIKFVMKNQQCMVFVHSRRLTFMTANVLKTKALEKGQDDFFKTDKNDKWELSGLLNRELRELLPYGFAIHHAGMIRKDRSYVERLFREGKIMVLVTTSTLAWGVNLPAHCVIIRGTKIYDSAYGNYIDLGMLDVMQIFGRAGRPQYDKEGHGIIITTHEKLRFYLSMLNNQYPIESQFEKCLLDNLNAEIVLGTVTTIHEAIEWLGYTYFYIRMFKNPLAYGINYEVLIRDQNLFDKRHSLVNKAAINLDQAKMIRFDENTGCLDPTDLGRIASHFYIKHKTVTIFNDMLNEHLREDQVINLVCSAEEFDQLKSREEEMDELNDLRNVYVKLPITSSIDSKNGKVNILLQSYISRAYVVTQSLISDTNYIVENAIRISRGLFEYVLTKGYASLSSKFLILSKMIDRRTWWYETPFSQFNSYFNSSELSKITKFKLTVDNVKSEEMTIKMLAHYLRSEKRGSLLKEIAYILPSLDISANIQPITRTILRVNLEIKPGFYWNDQFNGKKNEIFWIWIQDSETEHIYCHQYFKITKKQVINKEVQNLSFIIPLVNPDVMPTHYLIHVDSDRWLGCDKNEIISSRNLKLPHQFLPFTKLLDLKPLPVTALKNKLYESLYKFKYFNPIQTQLFHSLYHTDNNILLGAPTGSGKTNCAEIAMFRAFNNNPKGKVVYIAPIKALVRERVKDWKERLEPFICKNVIELTGDSAPDIATIINSDIIVTTPEKWDGVSRSWTSRKYVQDVDLIIIDEVHMLGEDRGPVLEVIVSRTNFISNYTKRRLRIVALSTAIANAQDLAGWLSIGKVGLYNFKPSVRPVPLEVHISGFPGKNYCPRMAAMNKPTFKAIKQHSPSKPVLVFVSSRRQTRLTAFALISFVAQDNPKQWLNMSNEEIDFLTSRNIKDPDLKLTLAFGIGFHHAGLHEKDRAIVEELFLNCKIQVIITTATLAWGINLPAHLVIIKGTEYYDGKIHRYVDFPITDVLQMIGRAGRPQFDDKGKAVIFVQDVKKEYYKKFLYEPFPVESHLVSVVENHLNAEICAGTIETRSECIEYLTFTYLFRRVLKNPSYYGLESSELKDVNAFFTKLVDKSIIKLKLSKCIEIDQDDDHIVYSTPYGRISSYYYIHHLTVKLFDSELCKHLTFDKVLFTLSMAHEYNELPVRHNEDGLNEEHDKIVRFPFKCNYDSPHVKAYLLFQSHFSRLPLPCSDYNTDLKSVLDQSTRIVQAMADISALNGILSNTIYCVHIMQMICQAYWFDENTFFLPYLDEISTDALRKEFGSFVQLVNSNTQYGQFFRCLEKHLDCWKIQDLYQLLSNFPIIDLKIAITNTENDEITRIQLDLPYAEADKRNFISLKPEKEYILNIEMLRLKGNGKVYAPKFPKIKDENWICIIGDSETNELIALKRLCRIKEKSDSNIFIKTPSDKKRYVYSIYFLSDCYIGLDQQFDFGFDIS